MTEIKNYIFNLETTKIELHFEKEEYDALSAAQKASLKSAFLWSSRGKCWVSRAKEPNLWRAKEVAKKLGFTEERRVGERLTFGERVEQEAERAEARAERMEKYADNAVSRAEQLQKPLNDMRGDIAFFTQPNINTSAGRAFTRSREKIFERYNKGMEEYRKSEYFKSRAADARTSADQSKYSDPAYLDRRIKECKSEIEKRNKNALHYEEIIEAIEGGQEKRRISGEIITAEEVHGWYDRELELIEVAIDKLGYLENRLEDIGGIKFSRADIKKGYIVRLQNSDAVRVVGVGSKNITYQTKSGFELRAAYAEIVEIIKAEEQTLEQPFKVGETYKTNIFERGKSVEAVYKVVKATKSTVWVKRDGSDEEPFTRKPKIVPTYAGSKWALRIDGYTCFYKEVEEVG